MVWYLEPHTIVEYATFQFNNLLFMLHKGCPIINVMSMVIKDDQKIIMQLIKNQSIGVVALELIKELERCFLAMTS
jgi:hypothetical protein